MGELIALKCGCRSVEKQCRRTCAEADVVTNIYWFMIAMRVVYIAGIQLPIKGLLSEQTPAVVLTDFSSSAMCPFGAAKGTRFIPACLPPETLRGFQGFLFDHQVIAWRKSWNFDQPV